MRKPGRYGLQLPTKPEDTMNKPQSLRHFLQEKVPTLRDRPDDFLTFIESGQLVSTQGGNPSFVYHYKLILVLLDFNGHADQLMVPLIIWLRANQPDILTGEPNGKIAFEAEILTNQTADIQVSIELTENVVARLQDEAIKTYHCGEPSIDDVPGPIDWAAFTGPVEVSSGTCPP